MNWVELDIFTTTNGVDPVCGCLLMLGITGFQIKDSKDFEEFLENKTGNWDYIDDDLMGLKECETTVTVYIPENAQGNEMLCAIKAELENLKSRDSDNSFGRLTYELRNVKEEDWANNWKQYFKPFNIGKKLLIKPSWEHCENKDKRKILEIDPASSFGTGQHNTTRLCLELLEKYLENDDRLLDLGCGSGILSIGGILLGAKQAVAVDIEENAVHTALENAHKNSITDTQYTAFCGNIIGDEDLRNKIGSGFNIITANIVADILIGMSPIFSKFLVSKGLLIMSGIIVERQNEVIDAVKKHGFELIETHEKDGWVAIAMRALQ